MLVHILLVYLFGWLFVPDREMPAPHFQKQAADYDYCRSAADNIEFVAFKIRRQTSARPPAQPYVQAERWLATQGAALAASLGDPARCHAVFQAGEAEYRRRWHAALAAAWDADRARGHTRRFPSDPDAHDLYVALVWDDAVQRLHAQAQATPASDPAGRWAELRVQRWAKDVEANVVFALAREYEVKDPVARNQLAWRRQVLTERYETIPEAES